MPRLFEQDLVLPELAFLLSLDALDVDLRNLAALVGSRQGKAAGEPDAQSGEDQQAHEGHAAYR